MRISGCLLTFAVPLAIVAGSCGALAEDSDWGNDGHKTRTEEKLVLQKTIDVGGNGLGAFDISFVDPKTSLYVLSDRTNGSVDIFDSASATFLTRIGAPCPAGNPAPYQCFQGVVTTGTPPVANNSLSGPDGVTIVGHKEIWAGDGDSRIKVINIASKSFVTTISTGGLFRVDEMSYDSRDHILAAANNADTPPFITLFNTDTKAIIGKMVFTTAGIGVDAENGIEQSQWSPDTGLFYVSVPQVGTDASVGGVSVIDPGTMKVIRTLLVSNCSPAGLTLGPHNQALVGCGSAFGTTTKTTQSVIIDLASTNAGLDGAVIAIVPIGGNDEVWYDKGTRHYFMAARSDLTKGVATPILGSVDALSFKVDPSASTSTTAHSVAADSDSHYVFVPIGFVPPGSAAGTDPTSPCPTKGCIAVYRAQPDSGDDGKLSSR